MAGESATHCHQSCGCLAAPPPHAFDFLPAWRPGAGLVVAHDVVGGAFAFHGGSPREVGRPGEPGGILHFRP
ncbi:DUF2625 family protein [Streptomyces sp. XY332]|uniref:DUF2625 family protein n=1 Tax=Streptomyces sp. XY332 TaxID=1415561 RepID=UPI002D21D140|nr:DUF2625 family protein [Streptomyces sp. XY332]